MQFGVLINFYYKNIMKVFVLHNAEMDSDGVLSINSYLYLTIEKAQEAQNIIIEKFINKNKDTESEKIYEEINWFKRVAYKNKLTEFQSCIKEFNI